MTHDARHCGAHHCRSYTEDHNDDKELKESESPEPSRCAVFSGACRHAGMPPSGAPGIAPGAPENRDLLTYEMDESGTGQQPEKAVNPELGPSNAA